MKERIKTNFFETASYIWIILCSSMFFLCFIICATMLNQTKAIAEDDEWVKGGPKFLYTKAKKAPPQHPVYDENIKCVECHKYNGVDAYTSATMTLKKSKIGSLPREKIEKRIAEMVKGQGDYREIYILSTSFENRPLATVIEFVLDPKTMTFYAVSERQGEKLFHIASNPNVSLAYVKQVAHHNYFLEALGVQVIGKAKLLQGTDPEFEEVVRIYVPTLATMTKSKMTPERIENIKKSFIATKVTAERIIIRDSTQRGTDYRMIQIWEREDNQ